jgi:hypothetical protein
MSDEPQTTEIKRRPASAWRWAMCDKKRAYQTEHAANRAAARHDQRVYECPVCFCWHLTSKEKAAAEEARK